MSDVLDELAQDFAVRNDDIADAENIADFHNDAAELQELLSEYSPFFIDDAFYMQAKEMMRIHGIISEKLGENTTITNHTLLSWRDVAAEVYVVINEIQEYRKAIKMHLVQELQYLVEEYSGANIQYSSAIRFVGFIDEHSTEKSINDIILRLRTECKDAEIQRVSDYLPEIIRAIQEACKECRKQYGYSTTTENTVGASVIVHNSGKLIYPTDAFSVTMFSSKDAGSYDVVLGKPAKDDVVQGSITFSFGGKQTKVYLSQNLGSIDFMVWVSAVAIIIDGNSMFTATQVYKRWHGADSRPNSRQLQDITERLLKMSQVVFWIDNKEEAARFSNRKKINVKQRYLLPIEGNIELSANGKFTDAAFHCLKDSVDLMDIAIDRNHVMTLTTSQLGISLDLTESTVALDRKMRLLIHRIDTTNYKITYKNLYEGMDSQQKRRAKNKVDTLLRDYKKTGFIKAYQYDDDSIRITPIRKRKCPKKRKSTKKKASE